MIRNYQDKKSFCFVEWIMLSFFAILRLLLLESYVG